jgi:predicted phosphodiesterase
MKIAALYDVHGNLPALEAVLEDVRREAFDEIVIGGDVFPGPLCNEALATLLDLELPVRFLLGNGDRETLAVAAGEEPVAVPEAYRPALRWVAGRLAPDDRRRIAAWPRSQRLEIDPLGTVLFCHATPGSDTAIFTRSTPEERLLPVFGGVEAAVVVCGHTHMQFDRSVGSVRVVNAGSVGMPFGAPGAYWLELGSELRLRRTGYDLAAAAQRIRACGFPQAEQFAARNVLDPPTEQEMLGVFSAAELR